MNTLTKTAVSLLTGSALLSGCGTYGDGSGDRQVSQRVYVGAGALVSRLEPNTDKVDGVSVAEMQSGGGSVTIGYDIANRISLEGHLASLGNAELDPAGSIDYSVGGISGLFYGLNAAGDRGRREGFSVFGRLGVGGMDNKATDVEYKRVNDVHLLTGAGVEYGLENGLGVRAEIVAHETDAKYAQLGLVYRFGDTVPGVPVPPVDLPAPKLPDSDAAPGDNDPATTLDQDGDGVVDSADRCSGSPAGQPVDDDGCAVFGGVVEGISFRQGSDTLMAEAHAVLDGVVDVLKRYPGISINIDAHTDNVGAAVNNLQLSRRRAIAVARYLVDAGISGTRLKPRAYGESYPRQSNATAAGRAANRRVEISVVE